MTEEKSWFRSSDKEQTKSSSPVKVLIVLERRCLTLKEEEEHLGKKQEVLADLLVSKRDMQKETPEKYQENIFEKFRELEEQRAKEALALAHRRSVC